MSRLNEQDNVLSEWRFYSKGAAQEDISAAFSISGSSLYTEVIFGIKRDQDAELLKKGEEINPQFLPLLQEKLESLPTSPDLLVAIGKYHLSDAYDKGQGHEKGFEVELSFAL